MENANKSEIRKTVTRRGFLKTVLPGLFAAGVCATATGNKEPQRGDYGNGPYGGTVSPKTTRR